MVLASSRWDCLTAGRANQPYVNDPDASSRGVLVPSGRVLVRGHIDSLDAELISSLPRSVTDTFAFDVLGLTIAGPRSFESFPLPSTNITALVVKSNGYTAIHWLLNLDREHFVFQISSEIRHVMVNHDAVPTKAGTVICCHSSVSEYPY